MFTIPGTSTHLPATTQAKRDTDPKAWLGGDYATVRLTAAVRAVRVHVGGGEGAASLANIHLAAGAGAGGSWYAIGDFIQTYDEYIASRALPQTRTARGRASFFTEARFVDLLPGTILNVGRAAPLFGHHGRGEQAQFLEGPPPLVVSQTHGASWLREYGHA